MQKHNEELPKSIISYNRKLRASLEKHERAFAVAGEKISSIRKELKVSRSQARRLESAYAKLARVAAETEAEMKKFKRLYHALAKEHEDLRNESHEAQERIVKEMTKRVKAEQRLLKIQSALKGLSK